MLRREGGAAGIGVPRLRGRRPRAAGLALLRAWLGPVSGRSFSWCCPALARAHPVLTASPVL